MIEIDFRTNVKRALVARGLTQQTIAERMGISKQQVQIYLRRNRAITIKTICRFADAIGCTPAELMSTD